MLIRVKAMVLRKSNDIKRRSQLGYSMGCNLITMNINSAINHNPGNKIDRKPVVQLCLE